MTKKHQQADSQTFKKIHHLSNCEFSEIIKQKK